MQQNLDTCWSELVENAIITSFLPSQLIIQISAWILTIQSHIAANGGSVELQMWKQLKPYLFKTQEMSLWK